MAGYGITDAAGLVHTHAAGDITSGILATARLGSGTGSASNFLRGDGAWSAVDWTVIVNKPTTFTPSTHTHTWSDITSGKPTTLAGYGITDAVGQTGAGASGTWGISVTGSSVATKWLGVWDATVWQGGYNTLSSTGSRSADLPPTTYGQQISWEFKSNAFAGISSRYGGLLTLAPWVSTTASTGDSTYQLLFAGLSADATTAPVIRARSGIDAAWGAWVTLYHSGNTHAHAAGDITSGILATARLASGTGSSSNFLRGDGVWSVVDWTAITNKPTTFTPEAHTHATADITSGTLPVSRGGTGISGFGPNGAVIFYDSSNTRIVGTSSFLFDGSYVYVGPSGNACQLGSGYLYGQSGLALRATAGDLWMSSSGNTVITASGATIGFLGASPAARQSSPSNATDLASAIAAVNSIKTSLQNYGLLT